MMDDLLQGIRRWVEIESHTPDIQGVAAMVAEVDASAQAKGLVTERRPGDRREHLIVRRPGTAPGILVMSHLDTVHPKGTLGGFPFRIEGDSAFGPGIYDMKGGAYIAHRAMAEADTGTAVTHLFTTDEEIGSLSSKDLIAELAEAHRIVLVTEPAREGGKIVTARKGAARWDLVCHGEASHSGSRHADGRSAILEMAHQIIALEALTNYDRGLTVNVGLVEGGTGTNVVPARARARIDTRIPDMAALEEVKAAFAALKPAIPGNRLELTGGLDRPPYERTPEIAALFEHAKALAAEDGWELQDLKTGGGSDGNFTAAIRPTLDGLGVDGKGGHTDYEQLYISSIVPRYRLMRRLLETL